jgi:hypothetical protein
LAFREVEIQLSHSWTRFRHWLAEQLPDAEVDLIQEDTHRESSFHHSGKPGHLSWAIVVRGKKSGIPFTQRYDLIRDWLHPLALELAPTNAGIPWDTSLSPVKDENENEIMINESDVKLRDAYYWVLFAKLSGAA